MSLSYLQQESTPLHPDSIWALAWTRPNHLVSACADGHLRVFDAAELSAPVHDLPLHALAITALSPSASGSHALTCSLDGRVVLSDLKEGREVGRIDTGREKVGDESVVISAYAASLHPEQRCYAYAGRGNKVVLRQMDAQANGHLAAEESAGPGSLGGSLKVVDAGKGKFGMDLRFSPDGQQVAVATESGQIVVLDTETQAVVATYTSHAMAVRTISWSPDSQWLYSGADDHRIVLHDVRAGSTSGPSGRGEGAVAIMQGHQSWVLRVAASPDSKLLGSGSASAFTTVRAPANGNRGADGLVKLWDVGQRACVSTSAAAAEVWGLDWQPADAAGASGVGKQFAIAGDDKAAMIYRAAGSA